MHHKENEEKEIKNQQANEITAKENTAEEKADVKETTEANNEQEQAQKSKDDIIAEQQARIEELNDKYLRLYAEFDNYRKRVAKERIEMSKMASADIIKSLLPVLDDLERAVEACNKDETLKAQGEGIMHILNKYKNILQKHGLEEIKAVGEMFNTDLHEAVANVPSESEEQKGKIVDQVEKGYFLNGTVLRFAKVVVAN